LAAGLGTAGDSADLGPLERLSAEIAHWRRIRRPEDATAMRAYQAAYLGQTARWTVRWPQEELAWRERLRALAGAPEAPQEVSKALDGAVHALGSCPGLRFPEDTRFFMARAAVRHGVRLDEARQWVAEAVRDLGLSLPNEDHPLTRAYRREQLSEAHWRAAEIRADLAYRLRDEETLAAEVVRLTAESAVPILDPADRIAVIERARRRTGVFLWRARLARLRLAPEDASKRYQQALRARPTTPNASETPENLELIEEARRYGIREAPGGGSPIPPAASAAPHWLPTYQRLEGFAKDGRPAVAVIWDGRDGSQARALERLEKRGNVRILSFESAKADWIQQINPLYAAPQVWIVDSQGFVRLIGRLQPGGDGWEDAVTGAAERTIGDRI
jgi:hypothetical protein